MHTALGDINRARRTLRLVRRLLLHSSTVMGVTGPGGTIAHGLCNNKAIFRTLFAFCALKNKVAAALLVVLKMV